MGGSGVGDIKIEEVISSFHNTQRQSVGKQLHVGLVGINGDFGHIFHPVNIALSANMDKGFVAEPCLVGIECVLLVLAVKGDKTLVILTVFATLVPCVAAEVEHIPYMGSPHILSGKKLLDQLLVVICLIFLGVVTLLGIGGVPVQCFTTVFRAANGKRGMHSMELVEPGSVHGGVATVPAEVVVVRYGIGNGDQLRVHGAGGYAGHGGGAGLVHLVAHIVEDAVIFQ